MGWQVRRLVGDQPWSDAVMWTTIVVGVVSAICVLGWTWCATENARRLVEPAARDHVPDPKASTLAWISPFAFVAVAAGVLAVLGVRADVDDARSVQAVPLAVAFVALLSAMSSMCRPLHHLTRAVRQVGGYSVRLARWLWVPVVLALVGTGSLAASRFAGFHDGDASTTISTETADPRGWAPLWMIAVVSIAPCIVTVVLAWRAASWVEDAVTVAASRRRVGTPTSVPRAEGAASPRRAVRDLTERIEVLPGADTLRLVTVTFLAGAALLSLVGASVVGLLWFDSRETGVSPVQRQRAWDALDALEVASRGVTIALIAAMSAWTFVTVLNIRMTSGHRRNPVIATLSWPAAAGAIWWIADRIVADASVRGVLVGFAVQAAVLAVPLLVLERSAATIGARRTPLRIGYALGVVLLVHVQGLGGLSNLPDAVTTTAAVGRLAGYLVVGALIQLCSTLAITEACRTMSLACRHEADHHNMLVAQRSTPGTAGQTRGGRRRESVARR